MKFVCIMVSVFCIEECLASQSQNLSEISEVLRVPVRLKSCLKSSTKKTERVRFVPSSQVMFFQNEIEKNDLGQIPKEKQIFTDKTGFNYIYPLNQEKRTESEIPVIFQQEEEGGVQVDTVEPNNVTACIKQAAVLVNQAARIQKLPKQERRLYRLIQGNCYRNAASILLRAIDHREAHELQSAGLDPKEVESLNHNLRGRYLELIRMAAKNFGYDIKTAGSNFHHACKHYLRTIQSLLHENEYEVYDELLNKFKGMIADTMNIVHLDPVECDDCLEIIRDTSEKEMVIRWLLEAEKNGFETRNYLREQVLLHHHLLLKHEMVSMKEKKSKFTFRFKGTIKSSHIRAESN